MRRFFWILPAILLLFFISACGSGKADPADNPVDAEAGKIYELLKAEHAETSVRVEEVEWIHFKVDGEYEGEPQDQEGIVYFIEYHLEAEPQKTLYAVGNYDWLLEEGSGHSINLYNEDQRYEYLYHKHTLIHFIENELWSDEDDIEVYHEQGEFDIEGLERYFD